MIEFRFHGRGGQGAVVGAKIFATALFSEGKFVQAFPFFGVERRGAPVTAFVRVNDKKINLRSQIYEPDHLVVMDHHLLNNTSTFKGFKKNGFVLINTRFDVKELSKNPQFLGCKLATVDASKIAVAEHLGSHSSPIVNTAIIGALCKITGLCSIDSVCNAIKKGAPINPLGNARAAQRAFEEVVI